MSLDHCGVDTKKSLQEDGTSRGIEIIPEGCQAVSEDVCASGYMAPADSVSFPENSLEQCCKCKEGESCDLCADPDMCTAEEKEEYVTSQSCFGIAVDSEEGEESQEASKEDSKEETPYTLYLIVCCLVLITLLTGAFLMTRRSQVTY